MEYSERYTKYKKDIDIVLSLIDEQAAKFFESYQKSITHKTRSLFKNKIIYGHTLKLDQKNLIKIADENYKSDLSSFDSVSIPAEDKTYMSWLFQLYRTNKSVEFSKRLNLNLGGVEEGYAAIQNIASEGLPSIPRDSIQKLHKDIQKDFKYITKTQ